MPEYHWQYSEYQPPATQTIVAECKPDAIKVSEVVVTEDQVPTQGVTHGTARLLQAEGGSDPGRD